MAACNTRHVMPCTRTPVHQRIRHGEKLKLHYELYTSASYVQYICLAIVAPKETVFRRARNVVRAIWIKNCVFPPLIADAMCTVPTQRRVITRSAHDRWFTKKNEKTVIRIYPVRTARRCSNILTRYERDQAIFRYNNLSWRGNCIQRVASTTDFEGNRVKFSM